jgi:hypothetical protein
MTATQSHSSTDTATVSVNVPLPAELHRRVKMAAAADGLTVKEAVILALQMWVTNG